MWNSSIIYEQIIREREEYKKILSDINKNEPIRLNESEKARLEVLNQINKLRTESVAEFEKDYSSIITVDFIIKTIKQKNYKKKKYDMERLAGYLSSKIQGKLQIILKDKSVELNKVIDKYVERFNVQINKVESKLKGFKVPFDPFKAFAGGLAGLAIWASTLGILGAYILVEKGVSVLSVLGISIVGGTAGLL